MPRGGPLVRTYSPAVSSVVTGPNATPNQPKTLTTPGNCQIFLFLVSLHSLGLFYIFIFVNFKDIIYVEYSLKIHTWIDENNYLILINVLIIKILGRTNRFHRIQACRITLMHLEINSSSIPSITTTKCTYLLTRIYCKYSVPLKHFRFFSNVCSHI